MRLLPKIALFLCLVLFLSGANAEEFFLVRDKKPCAVIVKPSQASQAWEMALTFFNEELEKCTGTRLAVADSVPEKGNFLSFDLQKKSLTEEDAFRIDFPGEREMRITCSPVSVRWAVNHLLEKELGVFYFAPPWKGRYGMEINHYPALRDAKVTKKSFADAPSLPFNRLGSHKGGGLSVNWNAKTAFTGTHMMAIDVFPVYKYAPDNSWPQEILPTLADGKKAVLPKAKLPLPKNIFHARRPYGNFWQPCWSNPATTRIAVENILEILAKNPEKKGINIDVNDMGGYCLCKECRKAVAGKVNSIGYADYSELYWKWVNDVAEKVCEKYPHVYFSGLAYCQVYDPPSFKLHKNIVPKICIETVVLLDEKEGPKRRKMLKKWKEKTYQLDLYDYLYGADFFLAPRIYFHAHSGILKELINDYNLRSAYVSSDARTIFQGPMQQLFLKVMWDPSLDVDAFLNKWYELCAGKEAAPYLRKYFEFWEGYWTGKRIRETMWYRSISNAYMALGERNTHTFALKKGDLKFLRSLMEKVVEKAGTEAEKKRAALLMESFTYTELACKAAFSEYFPPDGEIRTREEVLDLLKNCAEGFEAAEKFAKHPYTVTSVDKGRNLLPSAVGAFSRIMKFASDPDVRREMEKLSSDKTVPATLRAQFRIALGAKVKNYLPNGSFESLPLFGKWSGGRVDGKFVSDGKKSMKVRNGYCLYDIPNVQHDKTYLLLFDVYTEKGSAEGRLTYKLGFARGKLPGGWKTSRGLVLTPGSWSTYSAVVRLPKKLSEEEKISIRIPIWFTKFEPDEPVWVDNVRLYCLDEIE